MGKKSGSQAEPLLCQAGCADSCNNVWLISSDCSWQRSATCQPLAFRERCPGHLAQLRSEGNFCCLGSSSCFLGWQHRASHINTSSESRGCVTSSLIRDAVTCPKPWKWGFRLSSIPSSESDVQRTERGNESSSSWICLSGCSEVRAEPGCRQLGLAQPGQVSVPPLSARDIGVVVLAPGKGLCTGRCHNLGRCLEPCGAGKAGVIPDNWVFAACE